MSPRTHIASVVLAAIGVFAANGCVNNDPADPIAPGMTVSATSTMTTTAPTMSTPDTTMCGGTFEGAGDVVISANCTNAAPVNCNITSFDGTTYMLGSDWAQDKWDDGQSLTGGAFSYVGEGVTALSRELVDNALHVTGSIIAGQFAGFGFWFGPCQDASPFEGVQFTLSGSITGGSVAVQLQTEKNYPVDTANTKGDCVAPEGVDAWDFCKSNSYAVPALDAASGYNYYIPWAQFTGGAPDATLNPNQLLGVQFQTNCGPDAECPVDLMLHDLRFYRAHEAALGPAAAPVASTPATDPAPVASTPAAASTTDPAPAASTP